LNLDFAQITNCLEFYRSRNDRRVICPEGLALTELAFSAALDDDGTVAMLPSAAEISSPAMTALESEAAADEPVPIDHAILVAAKIGTAAPLAMIDPAVAELCVPLSETDPCGPDLDLAGDAEYLNFFAQTEGILPSLFFSAEDGKPFDRSAVDLPGQIDAIRPLWERSRDLRLLIMRARLLILNRDLGGFAVTIAAIAQWLDKFWDDVHPRAADGDLGARAAALGALDLPTVVFPLQYAPLCEGRRIGAVTYRAWMIAAGEVKPRAGEQKHPSAAVTEAIADAPPDVLAATRRHVAMLKTSLGHMRKVFTMRGGSLGLENLPALIDKMQGFVDPHAALREETAAHAAEGDDISATAKERAAREAVGGPGSLAEAQQALAAIADYYSRLEPSSPTLPLVRQAHQLIGKSFFEVMSILVPTQMDKAAFQIGADQFFELPVGKLSKPSEGAPALEEPPSSSESGGSSQYRVESRAQAIALLEQVQRFFRHAEPSSPVPMLCDRARALAERDFMAVLREVLPKAALKTFGAEK
jgi:type VI secretion system protein ImpA